MQKLPDGKIKENLKVIRAICGPMRFKILYLLYKNKKGMSVTELAGSLGGSLSRISHQLKVLKKYKMVRSAGTNRETIYRLGDHQIAKLGSILFK